MKIETEKGVLHLGFRHIHPPTQDEWEAAGTTLAELSNTAGTYCTIRENNRDGKVLAAARSYIHPLDIKRFNKEKGRTTALGECLKILYLNSKSDRRVVWDAYLNR